MNKSINKWNTDKSLRLSYLRKLIEFLQDGNEALYSGVSSLQAAAKMLFLIEDDESTIMLDESAWVHDDVRTLINAYIFRGMEYLDVVMTSLRPLYIFDLDGTLALIDHRRHLLDVGDYDSFYAACDKDLPNKPVIRILQHLCEVADIWIFSGRRDSTREVTIKWLERYTNIPFNDETLTMRKTGDQTADEVLKQSWLDSLLDVDRERLVAVFDDRDRVVDMWRANGITCLQVAPGNF